MRQAAGMSVPTTIVRFSELAPVPWANGLGSTAEIYRDPADGPFRVRVSVATIDRDAPFSALPGVDRQLLALGPDALSLVVDGRRHTLRPHDVLAFAGEQAVASTGVHTEGRDLNLMLRRGEATGTLRAEALDGATTLVPPAGGILIVVALSGAVAAEGVPLSTLDAAVTAADLRLDGRGSTAVLRTAPV